RDEDAVAGRVGAAHPVAADGAAEQRDEHQQTADDEKDHGIAGEGHLHFQTAEEAPAPERKRAQEYHAAGPPPGRTPRGDLVTTGDRGARIPRPAAARSPPPAGGESCAPRRFSPRAARRRCRPRRTARTRTDPRASSPGYSRTSRSPRDG